MAQVLEEEIKVMQKGKVNSVQLPSDNVDGIELIKEFYNLVMEFATILPTHIALDKELKKKYINTMTKAEKLFIMLGLGI